MLDLLVQPGNFAARFVQLAGEILGVADRRVTLALQAGIVGVHALVFRAHFGGGGVIRPRGGGRLAGLAAQGAQLLVEREQLTRRAFHLVIQPRIVALQVGEGGRQVPRRRRIPIDRRAGGRDRFGGGAGFVFQLHPGVGFRQLLVGLLQLAERTRGLGHLGGQRPNHALQPGSLPRWRGRFLLFQLLPRILDLDRQQRGFALGLGLFDGERLHLLGEPAALLAQLFDQFTCGAARRQSRRQLARFALAPLVGLRQRSVGRTDVIEGDRHRGGRDGWARRFAALAFGQQLDSRGALIRGERLTGKITRGRVGPILRRQAEPDKGLHGILGQTAATLGNHDPIVVLR